jgi:hypothetical protein
MAALPPPITTTLRPRFTASLLETASRKVKAGSTPFSSVPGRYTHDSFQVPMARQTASNCSSRSLSEISKPTRVFKMNFTPSRSMSSISRRNTGLGRRYSGKAKRSIPPASGRESKTVTSCPSSAR